MANRTGVKTYSDTPKGWLRERLLSLPKKISGAAVDAGHTGYTHVLRSGLTMGEITASSMLAQYDDTASDGTETAVGILMHEVDLKDGKPEDDATDHWGDLLVEGHVDASELIGWDAAAAVDLAGKIYTS